MKKLLLILSIALAGCASIPKDDMLAQIQPEIAELQKQIDNDIRAKIKQDKNYQKCFAENEKIRAIAEKHRARFPNDEYESWSTKEDCKTLADIEKIHGLKSFFEGFYYKGLGECEIKPGISAFDYRHKITDYCAEHYKSVDKETCESVFADGITINQQKGLPSLGTIEIKDDLSPGLAGGGRDIFRAVRNKDNEAQIGGGDFLYMLELDFNRTMFISEPVMRVSSVSLDCHKKDGRAEKYKMEREYKNCVDAFQDRMKYPATFCKCAAKKRQELATRTSKMTNDIERDIAKEQYLKEILEKCTDPADRPKGK